MLFGILFLLVFLFIAYWIIQIPIMIAEHRGIRGEELTTIKILSWVSILIGITWFIALILALIRNPNKWIDPNKESSRLDLDGLEKLYRLHQQGVLSEAEYQTEKKRLLAQKEDR